MEQAQKYRQLAAECLHLANWHLDPLHQSSFRDMARTWSRLADEMEAAERLPGAS